MADMIRKLNEDGLEAFDTYLSDLRNGKKLNTPVHLLTDPRYSAALEEDLEIDQKVFSTRFAMGEYLVSVFQGVNMQPFLGDRGFWTWIALYWFDQLCPSLADGSRKPSRVYNYILSPNYNHRPRHAVRTTWFLVNSYGDTSRFLLSKKPSERGELIEQLAARQHLFNCRGVIEAASRLYYDPERKTFKRGSTSTTRKGNIRRYISYLQQLDLTYDLYSMEKEVILDMLPKEYERFLPETDSDTAPAR